MSTISSMTGHEKNESGHVPVLLTTVLDILLPSPGEKILDVTLGLGGHAEAFLSKVPPNGTLIGLDADATNLSVATERLKHFGDRFLPVRANFRELPDCLPADQRSFDVILADLGLSSPHLDDTARGFSFHGNAPLDMRFDQTRGMTAADLLNRSTKEELTFIFQEYGELPKTHRFVTAILAARDATPFETSSDLNILIDALYGHEAKFVYAQIYQALRIAVNDELGALKSLLEAASALLAPGGRLGVISYHSLEDRLVKHMFRALTTPQKDPTTGTISAEAKFVLLNKKMIVPESKEIEDNPRARSAKFRAIQKLS